MKKRSSDQSIENEPHLREAGFRADPSEKKADKTLGARKPAGTDEEIDRTVWGEPGFSAELFGPAPSDRLTYRRWLKRGRAQISPLRSWAAALVIALLAGPWAVLGAVWGSGHGAVGVLAVVVAAPVVEETMKVAAPLYVVERRPFLFRNRGQIVLCALCSGVAFAAIENLLYLHVYVPDPSPVLTHWRWSVCVVLHAGCSLIAGMGVMRIWHRVWRQPGRPALSLATPYLVCAISIHGAYNALALALSYSYFRP
ncbi:MAG: PrsW family glutamic-type intramembrane protease [Planctomycetota bacterium]